MKEKIQFKEVIQATFPVAVGYLILSMGFGVMMSANGYSILLSICMSVFVYAGSMQYAAIGLFTAGASYLTVALTTLAVNARHLFYGISMLDKYKSAGKLKPYLAISLTDETYSLICNTEKGNRYCFYVSLLNQCVWVFGTFVGAWLGNVIQFNTKGIDFSLTALFVTVFVDQWIKNKDKFPAIVGVVCSLAMLMLFGPNRFLIPTMVLITIILLLPIERRKQHEQ